MKKILLSSLIAAAAAIPAFAGLNNINYQAVIKNGQTILADKTIAMKFELVDEAQNVVYTENMTPKSDANGLVVCQLGQNDDLTTLNWDNLTLKVSVNVGNGYEVISEEVVSSVPTAIYALHSADTEELKGQIENLNYISAVVRANEEAIEELNANTEAMAIMIETRLDKVQGNVDANTQAIEELNTNTEAFATMLETRLDKMQGQMDAADNTAEENYDDLKGSIERNQQQISVILGKVNENYEEYQEDWQSLAKFQEEISTDINEFKNQYAEDWQSLSKFQEEISTDITDFKNQYAEDWQSLSTFQQEISTDITDFKNQYAEDWQSLSKFQEEISTEVSEFKSEYQESFQKMTEFQDGVTTSIAGLDNRVEMLEDAVQMIVNPSDPESIINSMSEKMALMEEEFNAKIAALEAQIEALKAAK